jgi:chemotaxis protein histidine kinase CheA
MVKNQVEQLGGTITVTSAVNQGTQFTIQLPNS